VLLLTRAPGAFPLWLFGLSVVHHAWSYAVLRRLYRLSVPGSKYVGWFPLANLVMDWVLLRSIGMCLTGRVTWRGTSYGPAADAPAEPAPAVVNPARKVA
jgi:hypothetical protein